MHRIGPDFQPFEVGEAPTYLAVYRDREDEVGFMLLNPISARLIDLIAQGNNIAGLGLLNKIADELSHPNPEVVVSGGDEILAELCRCDVLLGAREA